MNVTADTIICLLCTLAGKIKHPNEQGSRGTFQWQGTLSDDLSSCRKSQERRKREGAKGQAMKLITLAPRKVPLNFGRGSDEMGVCDMQYWWVHLEIHKG